MTTLRIPATLTACKLMGAGFDLTPGNHANMMICARLACDIHKLAKPCHKLAVAECNGEWWNGQRAERSAMDEKTGGSFYRDDLTAEIERFGARIDKQIAALNAQLEPFGFVLNRNGGGDGLRLVMAELPLNDSALHHEIG